MVKTEEILIKKSRSKKTICDIFVYEPENIEETALGSLYMTAELTANEDSWHLIGLISSLIKREYYSLPHRGPLDSLEASLKKANRALSELTGQGNLAWLGKIHFICAALNKEEDLFLAQAGAAQAWLHRGDNLTSITKKIVPSPARPHPAKTFQSVISGKVGPGDKLALATPALSELLSPPGLKQLFDLPGIAEIADNLNKTLREEKKPPAIGILLLEITPEENIEIAKADPKQQYITPPINLREILK
ncbi:MAG TPA: hypothetical protein DHI91_00045 [Candidatus Portnoybacteria bacterium]|nr:hypothetical protein [Candidatus Portnoybacteria bacterium]